MTEGIIQQTFTKFYREMTPCVEISELRSLEQELIKQIQLSTWKTKKDEKDFCHCLRCIISVIPIGKLIGDTQQ